MKLTCKTPQAGQGMVEYIIIVALIALAAIAAFTYFGDVIRGQTVQMASQVAGTNSTEGADAAAKAAADAENLETQNNVTLENFDERDAQ